MNLLKLIELQYQREIDRRHKQAEKELKEKESGEKVIDSPLRRAREYALSIANSPSPVKRLLKERRNSAESPCSPERYSRSPQRFSPAKYSPEKLSPEKLAKANAEDPSLLIKRTSMLIKPKATELDSVPQTPEKKKKSISVTRTKFSNSIKRTTPISKQTKPASVVKSKNVASLAMPAIRSSQL